MGNMWPFELGRYVNVTAFVATVALSLAAALIAAGIAYRRRDRTVSLQVAGWVLLAGSVASVLVATFDRPVFASTPFPSASNWVPFRDIMDEIHNVNRPLGMINVFGNVALFVPTGLLAGLLLRPTWTAWCLAPVLSTAIEVVQLFAGLAADIDDIILNTAGGTIGVCISLLIRRWVRGASRARAATAPAGASRVQTHDPAG